MTQDTEAAKHIVDAVSVGTVVATLAGVLPSIAAIFTICWTAIRIYETETVKKMLGRKTNRANKTEE